MIEVFNYYQIEIKSDIWILKSVPVIIHMPSTKKLFLSSI